MRTMNPVRAVAKSVRADELYRVLNGVFVVYQPSACKYTKLHRSIRDALTKTLRQYEQRPCNQLVKIEPVAQRQNIADGSQQHAKDVVPVHYETRLVQDYGDHPLVVGPRIVPEEIRLQFMDTLDEHTAGVLPVAIGEGSRQEIQRLRHTRPMCVYQVDARVGIITTDNFTTGRVQHRIVYDKLSRGVLEKKLMTINSICRGSMLRAANINPQSQAAYEALSKGFLRPDNKDEPVIYAAKCTSFKKPNFSLEVHCVNITTDLLTQFVYDLGMQCKTGAAVNSIRRIRVGPLTLDHALISTQWDPMTVIENIKLCRPSVKKMYEMADDMFFGNYEDEVQGIRTTEPISVSHSGFQPPRH